MLGLASEGHPLIVAYLRVSSRSQSIATQQATIEQAARRRGDTIAEWHSETESGRKLDRPVLSELRSRARLGELERLYVYKLDRVTRSGIRDTLAVVEELTAHGCQLVSIADPFDLASPAAPILIAAIAWAAQMERQMIGDRVADARRRVEARGGRWGRPSKHSDAALKRAATRIVEGTPLSTVARETGMARSTLYRAVKLTRCTKMSPQNEAPTPGKDRG